ncbi:excalibur calcium-binding domain-containing protein [Sphingomonas hankookensis]
MRKVMIVALLAMPVGSVANATPGGLNAQGCHNDRKGGTGYHCHRSQSARSASPARTGGAYANCSAARAAGAAPVRRGEPGYGRHLDRDNDGIGCE